MVSRCNIIPFAVAWTLGSSAAAWAEPPAGVRKSGQSSTIKLEHAVQGYLRDLEGRYKLRVTEVTYAPGGYIGNHHHAGPGIRCITDGELTYVQPERTTVYKPGDCFFESGMLSHTAENRGKARVRLLNFELLPATLEGSSPIPVPAGAQVVPEPK